MPDLSAASERAVAAVFVAIGALLHDEAVVKKQTTIRGLIRAVAAESEHGSDDLPKVTSRKWDDWEFLLESFEDSILWDNDWAAGDHFLDLPPDEARTKM